MGLKNIHSVRLGAMLSTSASKPIKRKVRFINSSGSILNSYDVDNFDNCFITEQDSYKERTPYAYIVNGNLYYYKNSSSTLLKDNSGLCTCCDPRFVKERLYYVRDSAVWSFSSLDATPSAFTSDKQMSSSKVKKILTPMNNGRIAYLTTAGDLYYRQTDSSLAGSSVQDMCGNAYVFNGNNYYSWFVLYKSGVAEHKHYYSASGYYGQSYSNYKYITCYSYSGYVSSSTKSPAIFCGISTVDNWMIADTNTGVQVSEITAGVRINSTDTKYLYAVGLDKKLYYSIVTNKITQAPTVLDDSGEWQSVAALSENTGCLAIKDGKVYKIVGTTITELVNLGTGNTRLRGCDQYLLYTEE